MNDTMSRLWDEIQKVPTHERLLAIAHFGPHELRLDAATLLTETCVDREHLLAVIELFPMHPITVRAGKQILADDEATPLQLATVMAEVPPLADEVAARILSLGQPNTILTKVVLYSPKHRERAWTELLTRPDLTSLLIIGNGLPEFQERVQATIHTKDPTFLALLRGD